MADQQTTGLHPWAAMVAPNEGENVSVSRVLLSEWAHERDRLRAALEWYGENARLARLIHSEGDKGRHALDADGGKRAREALGQ